MINEFILHKHLSPLEQFELILIKPIKLINFDISFHSISFYLIVILSFIFIFIFSSHPRYLTLMPLRIQIIMEHFYKFIYNVLKEQCHTNKIGFFFPLFFLLFLFILSSNLIGLIPFSFTLTSHIALTFLISLSFNFSFVIIGLLENGSLFFKLFVPEGAPKFLLPLIVVIELVSYLIRTFSLSIRLFANIMASHTLLHILSPLVLLY